MVKSGEESIQIHSDYEGAKLGMWLFLFTELLLFGGLFVLYSVYRSWHIAEFKIASEELSRTIGTVNTLVLLTSSLFIALSIHFLKEGKADLAKIFLFLTILLGAVFIINKVFEWDAKFHHGIYPNSEILLQKSKGEILFFGLYFVMTGLHGLHVFAGILVLFFILILIRGGSVNENRFVLLENAGLYWHFVDIIWVFLFPLFYLIV
jgi:cytochrome c oxidase subunit 3